MENYFALISYALKDSGRAVRILKFIRGSCNCHLLEIQKQLQNVINWWPDTAE